MNKIRILNLWLSLVWWHLNLAVAQTKTLDDRCSIIYEDGDYTMSLIRAGIDTLESWREHLTKRFFKRQRSVMPETSCLHYMYLLPEKRGVSVTGRLRHARTFEPLKSRTVKFSKFFHTLLFKTLKPLCRCKYT